MTDTQDDTSMLGEALQKIEASAQNAPEPNVSSTKLPIHAASDNDPNNDPTELTPTWYWIKDSNGNGSIMATLTFVSFWITTIAYVLAIFDKIGPISIRPFDVSACAAYFIPVMTAFVGKHMIDSKNSGQKTGS